MSNSNLQARVDEVSGFLRHKDNDLARRRLLDLAYDFDDADLLKKSVLWSKKFVKDAAVPETWFQEAAEICSRIANAKTNARQNNSEPLIQSEGISKTYNNGFFSLHPIPLSLKAGEIVGVVGENGNGKTTLLRSIAGQLSNDLGPKNFSYLKGEETFYYELKYRTGFIPQRIPRWYGRLQDNLHFSAALQGLKGAKNDLMVEFVLERFGLTRFANLTWTQISSGYRTRFEIARLVLQRPPVLILDEPLANLDIIAQQTLLQDLRFIAQSELHPIGVILTSQQLFEVEKVADRVLFIQQGKGVYNEVAEDKLIKVFEIETKADRSEIAAILGSRAKEIRFNGGIFEIETENDEQECLELLVNHKVKILYFRNITNSAKRYF